MVIFEVLMHLNENKWFSQHYDANQAEPEEAAAPEEEGDQSKLIRFFARGILLFLLDLELFGVHVVTILHFLGGGRSRLDLEGEPALVIDICPVFGRSIDEVVNQVDHFLGNRSTRAVAVGSRIIVILTILIRSAEDFLILIPDNFAPGAFLKTSLLCISRFLVALLLN